MGGDEGVTIGEIVRPHGIRGEVRVQPLTERTDRFLELEGVFIGRPGEERWVGIEECRFQKNQVILRLEGVINRNQAEALRGASLRTLKKERPNLARDHYYVDELVGLKVETPEGEEIGSIVDVLKMPAQDLYVVKGREKEILIPAVKAFIRRVDIEGGIVVVDPIEGLI